MSEVDHGRNFAGLLALLFIGLKLGHVITWSWWWVLSPLWIPALVALLVLGVVFVVAVVPPSTARIFYASIGTALVGALLLLLLTGCTDDFKVRCEQNGGHVDTHTDTGVGTGVSSSGKPVVVTTVSETRYCIKDGGITDVD